MMIIMQEAMPENNPEIESFISECGIKFVRDPFVSELPASYFLGSEDPPCLPENEIKRNSLCLVARTPKSIVGVLTINGGSFVQTKHVGTLRLFVDPNQKDSRISSRLLRQAIEWAKKTNTISRIQVQIPSANHQMIKYFEALGFTVEGRIRQSIVLIDATLGDTCILALFL